MSCPCWSRWHARSLRNPQIQLSSSCTCTSRRTPTHAATRIIIMTRGRHYSDSKLFFETLNLILHYRDVLSSLDTTLNFSKLAFPHHMHVSNNCCGAHRHYGKARNFNVEVIRTDGEGGVPLACSGGVGCSRP